MLTSYSIPVRADFTKHSSAPGAAIFSIRLIRIVVYTNSQQESYRWEYLLVGSRPANKG